ncbi:MAG: 1-deoxy-D-xylulose-5-phosphate synthase [bacterium]|nr:1-deoxy-D-xylulose-5-phosphate synthase [bacterium]
MNKLLDQINSPKDIKSLSISDLETLAKEIRELIIHTVSSNGGHLSSNLGVVELILSLHYIFNSPQDKIILDVGHQSYAHKILTGRKEKFGTLRKYEGISGFPRKEESIHDAFNTGHSSTSISVAIGMAAARDLNKEDYKIIALIGDGSIANGLAFEALNHGGHIKKDIIVVLNSNEMSISPSVGALSSYLNRLITAPIYNKLKNDLAELVSNIPIFGERITNIIKKVEEGAKNILIPGAFFEELGFRYFGPIAGHNLSELINTLYSISKLKGPLLLHVITKKGKGYLPAENNPSWFHGSSPFNITTGKPKDIDNSNTYSQIFGNCLIEEADKDDTIIAITAAMAEGTGLSNFQDKFPDRFFDVGIAEGHGVAFAAGLTVRGYKPIVAIYSTFLQRAYDQIIHDVCLPNLPVVFIIDRAGIVGEDGPTHHGLFDITYLSHIPNMTLMSPKDGLELKSMLKWALNFKGPVAIRFPKEKPPKFENKEPIEIHYGKAEILQEGKEAVIFAAGNMVYNSLQAANHLAKEGIELTVVNLRFIKPLDEELITSLVNKIKRIIIVENHVSNGGIKGLILNLLQEKNINKVRVESIGFPDKFIEHGDNQILYEKYGLSIQGIINKVKLLLK